MNEEIEDAEYLKEKELEHERAEQIMNDIWKWVAIAFSLSIAILMIVIIYKVIL